MRAARDRRLLALLRLTIGHGAVDRVKDNAELLLRAQAGRGVGQNLLRPHGVDVAKGDCGKPHFLAISLPQSK